MKAKPDDPELLKLKEDLEEVIKLTADLLGYDPSILDTNKPTTSASFNEAVYNSASSQANNQGASSSTTRSAIRWKTGDRCLAPWNEDGKYVEN